jgi:hypothetical protein
MINDIWGDTSIILNFFGGDLSYGNVSVAAYQNPHTYYGDREAVDNPTCEAPAIP